MKLKTTLIFSLSLLTTPAAWTTDPQPVNGAASASPSRTELLNPAPNPTWSRFSVQGYDTLEIAPGLYTFRYTGTRNIFMVTKDGVIATDPISPEAARVMRDEIRKVTDQPVRYVVYSHNHWDHIPGGQIFRDEGAKFIAQENCVAHFRSKPHPDIVMPDITFTDRYTVELGGRTLDLIYLGANHGDCLTFMRPDAENGKYLFAVDIATPGGTPLNFMAGYSPDQWLRTLKELEAMDFSITIPGHGVPMADKSSLVERRIRAFYSIGE